MPRTFNPKTSAATPGSWSGGVRKLKNFPEDSRASLKTPSEIVVRDLTCDDLGQKPLDGRGRRAGWSPAYNDAQKAKYFSEWARQQRSLDLIPTLDKLGLIFFKSQRGANCPTYVVRTPEFDGSKPNWWEDFPANLFEIITPVFWENWPANWPYPPDSLSPFINGEPLSPPVSPGGPGTGQPNPPSTQQNLELESGGIFLELESSTDSSDATNYLELESV
jgi:hypothetical protein